MFLTNLRFPQVKTTIGRVAHVEVGRTNDKKMKKSIKNRLKIEAQDGWLLGIDFWWIFVGFGRQVGTPNRIKIDLKRHQKRDAKK